MACFECFFRGSKSWLALLVPIFALFAKFSNIGALLIISITVSLLVILLSTLFHFTFSKQRPISPQEKHQTSDQEKPLLSFAENSHEIEPKIENEKGFVIRSQDLYSESESMDHFSSTCSSEEEEEEDHSSDIEWPYNMGRHYSDGSISDEESLIEIAIPSGEFVSPKKVHHHNKFNLNYCKLSADQESMFQKQHSAVDFLAGLNEEDNLIEIDIYMGSIKCSSF